MQSSNEPEVDWSGVKPDQSPIPPLDAITFVQRLRPGNSIPPQVLPPDEYFLRGDNRDNSNDSRFTGPVLRSQLLGKTRMIYFSYDSKAETIRWDRIGRVLQ
jgi:signal peptidase I